jgi:hypothetical protein
LRFECDASEIPNKFELEPICGGDCIIKQIDSNKFELQTIWYIIIISNQMTTHFPQEIFKNILSYCDDTIERKQRQLWKTIKPVRCEHISNGMLNGEYDEDEKGKVDIIWIGFVDDIDCPINWLIKYDNWDLDEDDGECLLKLLEDENIWRCVRENNYLINNLSQMAPRDDDGDEYDEYGGYPSEDEYDRQEDLLGGPVIYCGMGRWSRDNYNHRFA